MQPEPQSDPGPSTSDDREWAMRLAARLAGRPERRDQVIAKARARLGASSTEAFCDALARDLIARFDKHPGR